jgi:hypothetical protein
MRNPVATPASVILGTLLLGFLAIVVFSYVTTSRAMYVLESGHWTYIWQRAFILFTDSFGAFQCAGALLAFSLFLSVPVFYDRKAFFRYLSSVLIGLIALTVIYVVLREGFQPLVKREMRATQSLGLFSDSLYQAALDKKNAGDRVTALEYVRFSLLTDGRNPAKIAEKSALISNLSDAEYERYQARITGADSRDEFDEAATLERARAALDKKDFPRAFALARAVLAMDPANPEALRIAGIAGEKSYRENALQATENERYLYNHKKEAVTALEAGEAGSARDLIRAYYLLEDLHRRFPLDANTAAYRLEAGDRLPGVSFFSADAELALSFENLVDKNLVFFNPLKGAQRELVSIDRMVSAGAEMYFKNIEVTGFDGRRVLYHYLAPLGKRIGEYINMNGIDRTDPERKATVQVLSGVPVFDRDRGLKLFVNPDDLRAYSLSRADIEDRGLGELAAMLPPLRRPSLYADHARMDELIIREIVLHIGQPLFLLILSLACFCIGRTQNARYLASVPKGIYAWVLVIPFVMLAVMGLVTFLYRMGMVFLFDALGPVIGIIVIAALHVFFLFLALARFSGKIGASLRK